MQIEVLADANAVATRAAQFIAAQARAASAAHDRFTFAVSGGHTPWQMLRVLASESVPWQSVHLFQVDERVAPADDQDRNLTHIRDSLLAHIALPAANMHAMGVEAIDLGAAAASYAQELDTFAGAPAVLDLVHLGLGPDGHTASLIPGDPVLAETHLSVALTGPYQGRRRMTLTYPILNRARCVLFVVTGAGKVPALAKLRARDPSIPASCVTGERVLVIADALAAGTTANVTT